MGINPTLYYNEQADYFLDWCADADLIRGAAAFGNRVAGALGVDPETIYGRTIRRLFEYPVTAFASFDELGHSFFKPAGPKRMEAVACAVSRIGAVIFLVATAVILIGVYLACCWPCFNCATSIIYFCCLCGLCRRPKRPPKMRVYNEEPAYE